MTASSDISKRRHQRFSVVWPVMIDHRRVEHSAKTIDVSSSGVRLYHHSLELEAGALCFFRVHAAAEWVALSGRVIERCTSLMRVELYGVGHYDQTLWQKTLQALGSINASPSAVYSQRK